MKINLYWNKNNKNITPWMCISTSVATSFSVEWFKREISVPQKNMSAFLRGFFQQILSISLHWTQVLNQSQNCIQNVASCKLDSLFPFGLDTRRGDKITFQIPNPSNWTVSRRKIEWILIFTFGTQINRPSTVSSKRPNNR